MAQFSSVRQPAVPGTAGTSNIPQARLVNPDVLVGMPMANGYGIGPPPILAPQSGRLAEGPRLAPAVGQSSQQMQQPLAVRANVQVSLPTDPIFPANGNASSNGAPDRTAPILGQGPPGGFPGPGEGPPMRQPMDPRVHIQMMEENLARERGEGGSKIGEASVLSALGHIHKEMGQLDRALGHFQTALIVFTETFGPAHQSIGDTQGNIGCILEMQQQYDAAISAYERAIQIHSSTLGQEHPIVAETFVNKARVYGKQSKHAVAADMLRQVIAIRTATLGAEHPTVGDAYGALGLACQQDNFHISALDAFEKAVAIHIKIPGKDHPVVGDSYAHMATSYKLQNQLALALDHYGKALTNRRTAFGDRHPLVGDTYALVADIHSEQGSHGIALPLYEKSLQIHLEALGEKHPRVGEDYCDIGNLYEGQKKFAQAIEMYEKSLTNLKAAFGRNEETIIGEVYMDKGRAWRALQDGEQAYNSFEAAHKIFVVTLGPNDAQTKEAKKCMEGKGGPTRQASPMRRQASPVRTYT